MRKLWPTLAILLPVILGGCVQYPNGTWGPPPAPQPAVAYAAPPPGPPVIYSPPPYAYYPGVPVYAVPQPPPPVYAAPPVSIGIGLGWGGGYWGRGPGYWGRPYYGRRW